MTHPLRELAPRDIVARAVFAETCAGRRPCLDLRALPIAEYFPTVFAACLRAGLDPARDLTPVTAAAHYHMGGIAVDLRGRSSLPGLWAAGEAACTGLHGANRLASNGLLEALVLGRAAGIDIAAEVPEAAASEVVLPLSGAVAPLDAAKMTTLRETMATHVGVIRDERGLSAALAVIADLTPDAPPAFLNMAVAARMIATAALRRQESRGAQCRTDFPGHVAPASSFLTLDQT